MRVVIAGASGLLGSHLVSDLQGRGHQVVRLVRREPASPDESRWDPYAADLDSDVIEAADVVVNVAGSALLGNPHSAKFRNTLRDSRVITTTVLGEAIAASASKPAFIAQNASAWYGGHGAEVVTEQSESRGDSFMTRVAREWQDATDSAARAGARVCLLRTVPVMDRRSLTFKVLTPVFRLGLGARLGDGTQYFPVMSLRDWVGAASHLVEHATASGPFNLCSPEPPTNREFTDAFACALGRKARLVAPGPVLRLGAGPLAPDTLDSFRLVPAALENAGYAFEDRDVSEVIAAALSKR